ncbi:hypothetical protein [Pseudomonas chlororaphis]|uniref:hypothetical protein n=1 Tax=Pseudomonas chlororaphis TaxID=587753 RepID=UPI003C1F7D6E
MRKALLSLFVNVVGTIIGGLGLHWILAPGGVPEVLPKATYAEIHVLSFYPNVSHVSGV